jgi:cytidylate kinase
MIITLSGQPGSGKTSVAKEIGEKYGFVIISAGEQFRKLAAERACPGRLRQARGNRQVDRSGYRPAPEGAFDEAP